MAYTTASGVSIPQGTDAFSPTNQFKTWADGAAAFQNRVIVADDTARLALTTPILRKGLEVYVNATDMVWTYDGTVWNKGILTNLQLDTTNSVVRTITQFGSGMIVGNNSNYINEVVTFPIAFASVPMVMATANGSRAGAYTSAGGNSVGAVAATHSVKSTTGFTIGIIAPGGSLSSGVNWYYDWIAIGVPA